MTALGPGGRVALYYAPEPDDELWTRGVAWHGRDPAGGGGPVAQPEVAGLFDATRDAAAYGFHATLRPPMRLRDGVDLDDLLAATRAVAAGIPPFTLPALQVSDLFGFLALTEIEPSASLQAYADALVAGVDHLRAPPAEAELARRRRAGLAGAEEANLVRWGYPYVFATWFFHMTLTRKLDTDEQAHFRPAAESWFAEALDGSRKVRDVAVFVQPEPGEAFVIAERVRLGG